MACSVAWVASLGGTPADNANARRRVAPACLPALRAATPRPRQQPASRPRAGVRGRRAVVKDVGVRPPNDGQAAADDARPHDRQKTLPQRRCTSCVRVDPPPASSEPRSCTLRTPIHLPPRRRRLGHKSGHKTTRAKRLEPQVCSRQRVMSGVCSRQPLGTWSFPNRC